MPDRAKLQIRLLDAERGLGLGELHVSAPEFFRTPVRHVAAQHITALAEPRPLSPAVRSEEHTSELQSRLHLVCRLLLEKKKKTHTLTPHPQTYNKIYYHRP